MKTAIVIGGGIAGCSTAYALAKRGISVILIERHIKIAAETSGNALAMLYPRLSGDNHLSQFALTGYLHTLELLSELNIAETDFNACGLLQLGFNARELTRIEKVGRQNIANIKYITAHAASKLADIELDYDALYISNAGWVKPAALCKSLITHKNISVLTLSNVYKILISNKLIEINFNKNQSLSADIVVVCNANDAQLLNQCSHIKTIAVRGQISLCKATSQSQQLKTIICGEGYLSPAVENIHSLGATFSAQHTHLEVNEKDHEANLSMLKDMCKTLHSTLQFNSGRAALRCSTPDYLPLVGQLLDSTKLQVKPPRPYALNNSIPWINGLYINVAHGSRGFISAPLCAELLACIICDEPYPVNETLAGLLNPNRFLLRGLGLKRLSKQIASS